MDEHLAGVGDFHDQFLLSQGRPEPPVGWQELGGAGWHLIAHPSLPVARLRTTDGVEAGFALGHLIDGEGQLARHEIELPMGPSQTSAAELEDFLYGFGGRFAFIVLLPGLERVYVDSMATLSTVWCGQRKRVASTPSLLLYDEPRHPLFAKVLGQFPGNRPNQFYPADLTAVPGIHRIVPNHVLDLRTWSASRHHPIPSLEEATAAEIPGLVTTFHEIVRRQIGAVLEACGGGYLALTAGHDSRRLLACARDFVDQLECVTLRSRCVPPSRGSDIDLHIATRLASRAGLRHRILPVLPIPREVAEEYVRRIGFAGGPGKACKFLAPPAEHLDLTRAWMTGHGGGLSSAKYMRRMPTEERPAASRLLRLLRLPERPGFTEAMERWAEELPKGSRELRFDLTVLENQGGGWASPHLYGSAPFRAKLLPLTHRDAIDAVLRVPATYRSSGRFDEELFRLAWPELLDLPFNEYNGFKRWSEDTRSALLSKARAARKRLRATRQALSRGRGGRASSEPRQ